MGDAVYAEQERKRILAAVKNHLLSDDTYREENRKRARITTKNRLQTDDAYREENRKRARITTKNRSQTDDTYRQENRKRARITAKKRWLTDKKYRELNVQRARAFRETHTEKIRLITGSGIVMNATKEYTMRKKNRGTRQTTGTDCTRFRRLHSRVGQHQMLNLHKGASLLDNKNTGSAAAN